MSTRHRLKATMAGIPRQIDKTLDIWSELPEHKPLLIYGPPKVGKTTVVEGLIARRFANKVCRIDCSNEEQARIVFAAHANLGGILGALRHRLGLDPKPGQHLLFFDNIESHPQGLARIQDLANDHPGLHIVIAGRLNEALNVQLSRAQDLFEAIALRPLTFCEFLRARKLPEAADELLRPPRALPQKLHLQLLQELAHFFVVGGFPASVAAYCATESYRESTAVLKAQISDLVKIQLNGDAAPRAIELILRTCALSPGEKLDYSSFGNEVSQASAKRVLDALHLMGLVHRIMPLQINGPDAVTRRVRGFKTVLGDVGLLRALIDDAPTTPSLVTEESLVAMSGLCDQFIGQEFINTQGDKLQFWASSARGSLSRVDYILYRNGRRFPASVAQALMPPVEHGLEICLGSYPGSPHAFLFTPGQYQGRVPEQKIVPCPYYYAFGVSAGTPQPAT